MKTDRELYIDRMLHDLKEWSATIDEYEIRASRGPTELQADYAENIRSLKEKYSLLSSKLQELQKSTGDRARELETGVEAAKHGLRDAFESARRAVRRAA